MSSSPLPPLHPPSSTAPSTRRMSLEERWISAATTPAGEATPCRTPSPGLASLRRRSSSKKKSLTKRRLSGSFRLQLPTQSELSSSDAKDEVNSGGSNGSSATVKPATLAGLVSEPRGLSPATQPRHPQTPSPGLTKLRSAAKSGRKDLMTSTRREILLDRFEHRHEIKTGNDWMALWLFVAMAVVALVSDVAFSVRLSFQAAGGSTPLSLGLAYLLATWVLPALPYCYVVVTSTWQQICDFVNSQKQPRPKSPPPPQQQQQQQQQQGKTTDTPSKPSPSPRVGRSNSSAEKGDFAGLLRRRRRLSGRLPAPPLLPTPARPLQEQPKPSSKAPPPAAMTTAGTATTTTTTGPGRSPYWVMAMRLALAPLLVAALPLWLLVGSLLWGTKLVVVSVVARRWWSLGWQVAEALLLLPSTATTTTTTGGGSGAAGAVSGPSASATTPRVRASSRGGHGGPALATPARPEVMVAGRRLLRYPSTTPRGDYTAGLTTGSAAGGQTPLLVGGTSVGVLTRRQIDDLADARRRSLTGGLLALHLPRADLPFDIALLNKIQLLDLILKHVPQFVIQIMMQREAGGWNAYCAGSLAVTGASLAASCVSGWSAFRLRNWASNFEAPWTTAKRLATKYRQATATKEPAATDNAQNASEDAGEKIAQDCDLQGEAAARPAGALLATARAAATAAAAVASSKKGSVVVKSPPATAQKGPRSKSDVLGCSGLTPRPPLAPNFATAACRDGL